MGYFLAVLRKQQREMTKLPQEREPWSPFIFHFYFKIITESKIQFRDSFDGEKQSKWLKGIARFVRKINGNFLIGVFLGVTVLVPY